jgi:hypothetical protein
MKIILRKDAINKKLKTYFTGKPCKHGHISERNTIDGSCKECIRENTKKEREFLKELFKEH